jgi:hypothetical protein
MELDLLQQMKVVIVSNSRLFSHSADYWSKVHYLVLISNEVPQWPWHSACMLCTFGMGIIRISEYYTLWSMRRAGNSMIISPNPTSARLWRFLVVWHGRPFLNRWLNTPNFRFTQFRQWTQDFKIQNGNFCLEPVLIQSIWFLEKLNNAINFEEILLQLSIKVPKEKQKGYQSTAHFDCTSIFCTVVQRG